MPDGQHYRGRLPSDALAFTPDAAIRAEVRGIILDCLQTE